LLFSEVAFFVLVVPFTSLDGIEVPAANIRKRQYKKKNTVEVSWHQTVKARQISPPPNHPPVDL
jgi:hypothetical protein